MSGVLFRISKLPNYIREYGFFRGITLWHQIEKTLPKKSNTRKSILVPHYDAPIILRDSVGDHATFWQCLVQNQYDFQRFEQNNRLERDYREKLRNGEKVLIIDCGGNIGLSTLWFAKKFPEAYIYVIEPDHGNFELLNENTRHLEPRVQTLRGGIWHQPAELRITNPDTGSAAFRVTTVDIASDQGAVRAYTIDEICNLAGVDAPFIVKLDIEGAQGKLFENNTEWVKNTHLIALELDDWLLPWQGTSRPFFSCLSQYPFDYLISGETIFCFRDFSSEA